MIRKLSRKKITKSEEFLSGFPNRLKSLMKEGEKDYQFADRIGVDPSSISYFLNGKRFPTIDVIIQICEIEGVNIDWLVKGRGDKYPVYQLDELERADGREPRVIGLSGPSILTDSDLAGLIASYIYRSGLSREAQDLLIYLVRSSLTDPASLSKILDFARFLEFTSKKT